MISWAALRGGNPWDLVIIAVEYRAGISGEYFDYLMDVLNQGTSVIVEAYHLDQISQGTVSTILTKCGSPGLPVCWKDAHAHRYIGLADQRRQPPHHEGSKQRTFFLKSCRLLAI